MVRSNENKFAPDHVSSSTPLQNTRLSDPEEFYVKQDRIGACYVYYARSHDTKTSTVYQARARLEKFTKGACC
jgi:hypothetical protein